MTYIAICLGMVFGQIIRFSFFLNRKERKKNKTPKKPNNNKKKENGLENKFTFHETK